MNLTYPAEFIRGRRDTQGDHVRITLKPGETAWRPDTTKEARPITGPAEVLYLFYPDGGIDAVVSAPGE